MQINIQGHGVELTPYLRDYAIKKLKRVTEFYSNIQKMEIVLDARDIKNDKRAQVAEVSIWAAGQKVMHAAAGGQDMYAAIDEIYEEIKRQIVKQKDKKIKERRREGREIKEMTRSGLSFFEEGSASPVVVKAKRFNIHNMTIEEAAAEQEMRGHDFYIFRNAESGELNVLHEGAVLDNSTVKTLSEDEASKKAVKSATPFLAFINKDSNDLNVIYKRRSGNFGLIQP
ncbi:MAG: ribosome-associated translation inhibitor RaiA, partial [Candidatus Margulisbacteria bacterium]|nr:ribosome-associated translation inhibitor RaiA [Candidatus Margulisiibacteriota bacterium]